MEQLTPLPQLGDPRAMEPWALPAWQSWTPGQGSEPGGAAPGIADTLAAGQVGELRPEESSEPKPEGAQSSGAMGGTDPEGTKTGLPGLGHQAASSRPSCPRLEDEEVEALPKVRELGRAGVYQVGRLLTPSSLGMFAIPLPTPLLLACLCLWVLLCDCVSSLLWAGMSVAPFFAICLSF